MPYTNDEARELGKHRGYAAADYAANVTRLPVREPAREDGPAMSDKAWDYFTDGWDTGTETFQLADSDDDMSRLRTPRGYDGVEHADGTVHAIDLAKLHDGRPLWRETPVCGTATGVSSDEGGPAALHRRTVTCWECASILA